MVVHIVPLKYVFIIYMRDRSLHDTAQEEYYTSTYNPISTYLMLNDRP